MPSAYPLEWPAGYERTPARKRSRWPHKGLTFGAARDSIFDEFDSTSRTTAQRITGVVISTNLETYERGGRHYAYANQPTPDDPGVAVYFMLGGKPRVLCCDAWKSVEANMRAIAITVRDLRRIQKRGVSDFLPRAYSGFETKQLPDEAGPDAGGAWWQVLGVSPDASEEEIHRAYRQRAKETHPDTGGSHEDFHRVTEAFNEAIFHLEEEAA